MRPPRLSGSVSQTKSMGKKSEVAWVLLLVSLGLACQHSENRYLHRNVQARELVGHWMATPFAMESLRYAGYKTHLKATEHRLSLDPDGSCQAETVAEPSESSPDGAGIWVSASMPCRWQLRTEGEHQILKLFVSGTAGGEPQMSFYF